VTTNEWVQVSTQKLKTAGIESARLDCLIMCEDILGIDRAKLLAHPETNISSAQITKLNNLLAKRSEHVPLAYLRGTTEFYGRNFVINQNVLVPRPESETMIELLKDIVQHDKTLSSKKDQIMVSDVGTGSGALGITAALELPILLVELLDIDQKAVKCAKINVDLFTLNISEVLSDLLMNSVQQSDILLCNLPYVPDTMTINKAAMHEPKIALFGGSDGLDVYRKLFKQLSLRPYKPLYILLEAFPSQHQLLATLASKLDYAVHGEQDFIQVLKFKNI